MNRVGNLKNLLIKEIETQTLEFIQLGFSLSLVHYFLTMFHLPPFGIVIYIILQCMLKVGDLLSDFDFQRVTVKGML